MSFENVAVAALLVVLVFVAAQMFVGKIAPEKARELVKAGATLLDVRTPAEWKRGHLDGAKHIPLQELASRTGDVGPKDVPVVVYCASGVRSRSARSILKRHGFSAVHDLGAMARWG